jgi:hypothetical protein
MSGRHFNVHVELLSLKTSSEKKEEEGEEGRRRRKRNPE